MLAELFNHFNQTQSEKSVSTTNAEASKVSSRLPACLGVQSDRDTRLFSSCLGLAQGSRFPPSVSWGQVHYNPPMPDPSRCHCTQIRYCQKVEAK